MSCWIKERNVPAVQSGCFLVVGSWVRVKLVFFCWEDDPGGVIVMQERYAVRGELVNYFVCLRPERTTNSTNAWKDEYGVDSRSALAIALRF